MVNTRRAVKPKGEICKPVGHIGDVHIAPITEEQKAKLESTLQENAKLIEKLAKQGEAYRATHRPYWNDHCDHALSLDHQIGKKVNLLICGVSVSVSLMAAMLIFVVFHMSK